MVAVGIDEVLPYRALIRAVYRLLQAPQHRLYFFPLPHGHGPFRETTFGACWIGLAQRNGSRAERSTGFAHAAPQTPRAAVRKSAGKWRSSSPARETQGTAAPSDPSISGLSIHSSGLFAAMQYARASGTSTILSNRYGDPGDAMRLALLCHPDRSCLRPDARRAGSTGLPDLP
jgi:hypothetical protein